MPMIRSFLMASLLLFCSVAFGQKHIKKQIKELVKHEKYAEAYPLFLSLETKSLDEELIYQRGITLIENGQYGLAETDFNYLLLEAPEDWTKAFYHLGRALHFQQKYAEAADAYKSYLGTMDTGDDRRKDIILLIKSCKSGLSQLYAKPNAFVEAFGGAINSTNDEIRPVQSPNFEGKYYFSSNRSTAVGGRRDSKGYKDEQYGSYKMDMYTATLDKGTWSAVDAINPLLNSSSSDLLLDFNNGGKVLYFVKSIDDHGGEALTDTFSIDADASSYPSLFDGPIDASIGDHYLRFVNDTTIIFSSRREGGYGGYDIYMASKGPEGWREPFNLGPLVNSAYDEVAPYLSRDGLHLYYSSDRPSGLGGFDVYSQFFSPESATWQVTQNLVGPINSPSDDLYYSLNSDGSSAVFSSDRAGGKGGFDLYQAYLTEAVTLLDNYTWSLSQYMPSIDDGSLDIDEAVVELPKVEVEAEEMLLEPLFYGNDEVILTSTNIKILNRVAKTMRVFPDTKLLLTGNSASHQMPGFAHFFSIKRAEKAKDYLVDMGLASDRILLESLGDDWKVDATSDNLNARIDLQLMNANPDLLEVITSDSWLSEEAPNYMDFKGMQNGVSFRVKAIETAQMLKDQSFLAMPQKSLLKTDQGTYIYYAGAFPSYSTAKATMRQLQRKGFEEARVIPFYKGIPVRENQLSQLAQNSQELQRYIKERGE